MRLPISATASGNREVLEGVVEEAADDQAFGGLRRDAAALQVVPLVGVDGTHRRGVGAAHVVVLDLQVRHRLRPRVIGQLHDPVGLHRVAAASVGPDVDEPGVHRVGTSRLSAPLK